MYSTLTPQQRLYKETFYTYIQDHVSEIYCIARQFFIHADINLMDSATGCIEEVN